LFAVWRSSRILSVRVLDLSTEPCYKAANVYLALRSLQLPCLTVNLFLNVVSVFSVVGFVGFID
jgi:hypothetical protein